MQSHFRVETRSEGRGTVLTVTGELDLASAPALEEELGKVLEAAPDLVIVDLRDLDFIDSTGLSVLVRAHQRAQESECSFAVVKGGAQVQRLLSLTGLEDRLTLAETPEELLNGA